MAAVQVEGLSRHYGEREALGGVSLSLQEGQTLVVFGPNGAGKTTLLRVLATLLRPHAGDVRVLGASLPDESWAVRGRIGLLGHEPLLYRELTARENLRFHARLHGVSRRARRAAARARSRLQDARRRAAAHCSRAAWCSAWRSRARCCTTPSCCCSTSRARTSTRRPSSWSTPLIGAASGRTRVICSHDPGGGLAEADVVLGLRGGRPALLRAAADVGAGEIGELYR